MRLHAPSTASREFNTFLSTTSLLPELLLLISTRTLRTMMVLEGTTTSIETLMINSSAAKDNAA